MLHRFKDIALATPDSLGTEFHAICIHLENSNLLKRLMPQSSEANLPEDPISQALGWRAKETAPSAVTARTRQAKA